MSLPHPQRPPFRSLPGQGSCLRTRQEETARFTREAAISHSRLPVHTQGCHFTYKAPTAHARPPRQEPGPPSPAWAELAAASVPRHEAAFADSLRSQWTQSLMSTALQSDVSFPLSVEIILPAGRPVTGRHVGPASCSGSGEPRRVSPLRSVTQGRRSQPGRVSGPRTLDGLGGFTGLDVNTKI